MMRPFKVLMKFMELKPNKKELNELKETSITMSNNFQNLSEGDDFFMQNQFYKNRIMELSFIKKIKFISHRHNGGVLNEH